MTTVPRLLMLSMASVLLAACATPQLKIKDSEAAVEVTSKVPVIGTVDYAPDGMTAASGGFDGVVRVWHLKEGKEAFKLKRPGMVSDIAYMPDSKTIAIANASTSIIGDDAVATTLWDVRSGALVTTFPGTFSGHLSFSRDGKYVLGESPDGDAIALVDIRSGSVIRKFEGYRGRLSPNGKYVAVSGTKDEGSILFSDYVSFVRVFDAATGRQLWSETVDAGAMNFSPDSKYLLVAAHDSENMADDLRLSFRLFDAATGTRVKEFGRETVPGSLFSVEVVYHVIGALAFSPDGKFVISGDQGGKYRLWDIASGTMVRQLKTVDELAGSWLNAVPSVKFSPDGRTAIIASLASARLFDVSTGDELATMIGFEDGEWLVTTPNGYYNSSEKGDQYLSVSVGGKPYSISQLRESFYRPDLVKAALAGRSLTEFKRLADIKPPPAVTIIDAPTKVTAEEIAIRVQVVDQGGGIGDVRLYLNGSAVLLDNGRNRQIAAKPEAGNILTYHLKLVPETNVIQAVAFNGDNSMRSNEAVVKVEARLSERKPSLYALVVGIQEYENPRLALKYPVADANLVGETLRKRAAGLFGSVEVTALTSRAATTRDSIIQALRLAQSKVRPQDLFVFFVASHGTVDEDEYFLVTSNVGAVSTGALRANALSQNLLRDLIANIPAAKKLIMIDTCNAGKLGEAIEVSVLTRGMSEETAIKILSRSVGSTILSASTTVQEAVEGYEGHGLFTYVVVEGLNGAADVDKDGFVKTLELASYVDEKVPELADRVFRHKQYPLVAPSGQGFPIAKVR